MSLLLSLSLAETLDRLTGFRLFSAEARARHARYTQAVFELENMSERELNDIGISRADIHRVAREAAALG